MPSSNISDVQAAGSTGGGGLGGLLGMTSNYSANTEAAGNYAWNGPDVNSLYNQSQNAPGTNAQSAQINTGAGSNFLSGNNNAFSQQQAGQTALEQQLLAESQGKGPNPAAIQAQQAQQSNLQQALAMAASTKGAGQGTAGYNAQQAAAAGNANISQQALASTAAQQLAAQQQLSGLYGQQAGLNLSAAAQQQQMASQQAQLTNQQTQANQQTGLGYANAANAAGAQQLQGGIAQGQNLLGTEQINAGVSQANASANSGLVGAIASGGASLLAGGLSGVHSDMNNKTDINPMMSIGRTIGNLFRSPQPQALPPGIASVMDPNVAAPDEPTSMGQTSGPRPLSPAELSLFGNGNNVGSNSPPSLQSALQSYQPPAAYNAAASSGLAPATGQLDLADLSGAGGVISSDESVKSGIQSSRAAEMKRPYAGGAPGALMSDEHVKSQLKPGGHTISDAFLQALTDSQSTYRYKDPSMEPTSHPSGGRYLGVMAQALEKTPTGDTIVTNGPRGKSLEMGATLSAALAGEGRLNERVSALEHALSAAISMISSGGAR